MLHVTEFIISKYGLSGAFSGNNDGYAVLTVHVVAVGITPALFLSFMDPVFNHAHYSFDKVKKGIVLHVLLSGVIILTVMFYPYM